MLFIVFQYEIENIIFCSMSAIAVHLKSKNITVCFHFPQWKKPGLLITFPATDSIFIILLIDILFFSLMPDCLSRGSLLSFTLYPDTSCKYKIPVYPIIIHFYFLYNPNLHAPSFVTVRFVIVCFAIVCFIIVRFAAIHRVVDNAS